VATIKPFSCGQGTSKLYRTLPLLSIRRSADYTAAALIVFVVLFWRVGVLTFWDPDEAHYAQSSREMVEAGGLTDGQRITTGSCSSTNHMPALDWRKVIPEVARWVSANQIHGERIAIYRLKWKRRLPPEHFVVVTR
jgi:hypothetical protein